MNITLTCCRQLSLSLMVSSVHADLNLVPVAGFEGFNI